MGLYQRRQREAAQKEEKENPQRQKHERMQLYIKSRRRGSPGGGGYVTSEEMQEEQERYLADMQALRSLMVNGGVRGLGGGYRLAYLRSKYPTEYAHLRDIEIRSK
jgi:predicted phage gp36 major capsid-like protein